MGGSSLPEDIVNWIHHLLDTARDLRAEIAELKNQLAAKDVAR